ncbi:MAG: hypothetical protein LW875_06885 [Proteobacteria bacterium]|jgi:hypothetical protein|nr:hypothetical protein [Pseudomonadota bacterium]
MSSYSAQSFLFRGSLVVLSSLFVFGCAFKKDTGEETPIAPAAPQAKEVPKGFFKAEVKDDSIYHFFNVKLSWEELEGCIAQIKQVNLDSGQTLFLRVTKENLEKRSTVSPRLPEGTNFQFELSCLESPVPFVEAIQLKTPFDLVVDGLVTEENLRKRGMIEQGTGELRVNRLVVKKNGVLRFAEPKISLIFVRGNFDNGSRITNFVQEFLDLDRSKSEGYRGRPGSSLDIKGAIAEGHLTLDLRGYPGEEGEPGLDRTDDELPVPAKNGRDAQFAFAGWPRETKQQCNFDRDPSNRHSPRGDRFSAFRGCDMLFISCVREATDGENIRGLPGRPGGVGKQGGSTGSVRVAIIDKTELQIKVQATPGVGGPQGPGGRGGRSPGNPGVAGQVNFIPQLRQYLSLPATMSDADVMNKIHERWDWTQACQYTPKSGKDDGMGEQGESLNPSMVGPMGEIEDVKVWEESTKTWNAIRPTFLSR